MKNSKLIGLFRNFNKEDWVKFEKFAVSPYLNNGRNYVSLIREIKKFYPGFDSVKLTKEHIYNKLFPAKEYKDSVMKTMLTGLFKLAETFFMLDYLNSSEHEKGKLLSSAYSVRGDFEGLYGALKSLDSITDSEKIDYEYFYYKGIVESGKVLYYQRKSDKYVKHQEHSINRGNYIIMDLLLKLPQILNDSFYSHNMYNESRLKDISFVFAGSIDFKKFVNELDSSEFQYNDLCKLFTYTVLLYTDDGNTDNFFEAKKLYENCFDELSFQNQYIFGLLISNYSSRNKSASSSVFANLTREIYDFMLKKNIFFGVYGSFIPHTPFMRYVNSACECGRLDDAENFINKYSINLHERHRDQVSKRCLAQLYILKNNFNKALELLKDFKSDDITEILDLKRLHSIIYYELGLYDNLDYTVDSSVKMINANKFIPDNARNGAMLFFKYIKKLAGIRQKNAKAEAAVLVKNIQGGEYFLLCYWLINKLQEIEKQ